MSCSLRATVWADKYRKRGEEKGGEKGRALTSYVWLVDSTRLLEATEREHVNCPATAGCTSLHLYLVYIGYDSACTLSTK